MMGNSTSYDIFTVDNNDSSDQRDVCMTGTCMCLRDARCEMRSINYCSVLAFLC
jgi:hypothetical protein